MFLLGQEHVTAFQTKMLVSYSFEEFDLSSQVNILLCSQGLVDLPDRLIGKGN